MKYEIHIEIKQDAKIENVSRLMEILDTFEIVDDYYLKVSKDKKLKLDDIKINTPTINPSPGQLMWDGHKWILTQNPINHCTWTSNGTAPIKENDIKADLKFGYTRCN